MESTGIKTTFLSFFWEVLPCHVKGIHNKLVFVHANQPRAKRGFAVQPCSHGAARRDTAQLQSIMYLEMLTAFKDIFGRLKWVKIEKWAWIINSLCLNPDLPWVCLEKLPQNSLADIYMCPEVSNELICPLLWKHSVVRELEWKGRQHVAAFCRKMERFF